MESWITDTALEYEFIGPTGPRCCWVAGLLGQLSSFVARTGPVLCGFFGQAMSMRLILIGARGQMADLALGLIKNSFRVHVVYEERPVQ